MHRLTRLPARFPANTKYVLEARGPLVRRYVEFPDGRRIELSPRKAVTCDCAEHTLVPAMRSLAGGKRRKRLAVAA